MEEETETKAEGETMMRMSRGCQPEREGGGGDAEGEPVPGAGFHTSEVRLTRSSSDEVVIFTDKIEFEVGSQ